MSNLGDITSKLGEEYRAWKAHEKTKEAARKEFFSAVNQHLSGKRAEKLVEVAAPSEEQARQELERRYPAWSIDDMRVSSEGRYEAIIVENPEFQKFTFVNSEDGYVYGRSVSSGSIFLDEDRLQAENPELWERVTFVPEPQRQLKSFDELSKEDLAALTDFMYEGKPSVRLLPPRKATEEELSEL